MKSFKLLVILFFLIAFNTNAQQNTITLITYTTLDSLIEYNKVYNKSITHTDGFRIQIFSGNNRTNAEDLKSEVFKNFSDYPAYLIYQQPYFKLRIGDFKSRFDAQWLYNKLLTQYGAAIIVPDKINTPKPTTN